MNLERYTEEHANKIADDLSIILENSDLAPETFVFLEELLDELAGIEDDY